MSSSYSQKIRPILSIRQLIHRVLAQSTLMRKLYEIFKVIKSLEREQNFNKFFIISEGCL